MEEKSIQNNIGESVTTPGNETAPQGNKEPMANNNIEPAAKPRKSPKKSKLTFAKVFLAALLAVIAGSIATILFVTFLFSGISSMMAPQVEKVPNKAILHINLAESLVDAPSSNPMGGFDIMTMSSTSQLTIYDALRALESAAKDDRIEGIYINAVGNGSASASLLEELRAAIELFKQSGKWVIAYNESYSQWLYYLASAADKVYMQPEGSFEWMGLAMESIFFKDLFDKLGVEINILRPTACKYKSAVEPYFLNEMSAENREQTQQMANNMWSVLTEAVASSRGISQEELNRLADELAIALPSEALEHKFIDGIKYADQIEDIFEQEYGIEQPEFISLGDYASSLISDPKRASAPKVAIVYANGEVVDGSGTNGIYGYTLSKTIREVAEDDDIASVILRVNSPGGSALASDLIWREIELLKEKKPVIVSMGETAASGGYYISAPADAIVANRLTLTGSIGVFGMTPSYGKALKDKVGITVDGVSTNKHSRMSAFNALQPAQEQMLMRSVDRVYDHFTSIVAQGRNLTIERVLEIAEGRVWSGTQAQQIGLVDTCGGLTAAIAIAIDKAELGDNYQIVEVTSKQDKWMEILSSFGLKARQAMTARTELGTLYNEYKHLEQLVNGEGVYAICPYIYRF